MAIHIYKEKAHKNLIFVMDFDLIEELNPMWLYLKTKTGVRVSEYNDVIIFSNHMRLMILFIVDNFLVKNNKGVNEFLEMLKANEGMDAIYFEGE